MATFMGNRGFGSGIFRPVLLIASICLLMFLLYAYSSTNSELKQNKDRADRLTRQQEMLKTQVKGKQFYFTCIIILLVPALVVHSILFVVYA